MPKHPTTIRLDPALYKEVIREARKVGLNFSNVVHLLLLAFIQGTVYIGVNQYPEEYLRTIERESEELGHLYRKKKVNGYTSSKSLFDAILKQ